MIAMTVARTVKLLFEAYFTILAKAKANLALTRIVNYDCGTFIVQATDVKPKIYESILFAT
jgi:hypothetical protein